MLRYTGHPLVDVGVAALGAYIGKQDLAALTAEDLYSAARFLERLYTQPGPMQNLIRGSVFFNAGYYQPSESIRTAYVQRTLYSWHAQPPSHTKEKCSFCGGSAAYRANREDVPLLNGRHVYNFSAQGRAGLPICGHCSLALHMLPLGCTKIGRGLLAVHSENPHITFAIADRACRALLSTISMNSAEGITALSFERTRFIEMIVSAFAEQQASGDHSVSGYGFSNYGADPMIHIMTIDSGVAEWLGNMLHHPDATLTAAWARLVAGAWDARKQPDQAMQRNAVYEAVLNLPASARLFSAKYLRKTRHFGLMALFCERILDMTPEQIALLRALGDRFAQHARLKRGFFHDFTRIQEYTPWRRRILRAADDAARVGDPLITFDEFVQAFTAPAGEINDWRLSRDLVALRMLEHMQALPEDEPLFTFPEDDPEQEDV
jgi:CRISPR-associated protein Cst1